MAVATLMCGAALGVLAVSSRHFRLECLLQEVPFAIGDARMRRCPLASSLPTCLSHLRIAQCLAEVPAVLGVDIVPPQV